MYCNSYRSFIWSHSIPVSRHTPKNFTHRHHHIINTTLNASKEYDVFVGQGQEKEELAAVKKSGSVEDLVHLATVKHPGNVHYLIAASKALAKRGDVRRAKDIIGQAFQAATTPEAASFVHLSVGSLILRYGAPFMEFDSEGIDEKTSLGSFLDDDNKNDNYNDNAIRIENAHSDEPGNRKTSQPTKEHSKTAKKYKLAEYHFKLAADTMPSTPAPFNALGKLEAMKGNDAQAETYYKRALEKFPNHIRSLHALAVLLSKRKESPHAARKAFKRLIEASPSNPAVYQTFALFEWQQGNYKDAKKIFDAGIDSCPAHAPLLNAYAKIEAKRRNRTKARALLRQAIQADPCDPHHYLSLGQLEGRAGNISIAIQVCTQGLSISPRNVHLLCTLGQVMQASGDTEGAHRAWRDALDYDDQCAVAAHELGKIDQNQGRIDGAMEYFELGARSEDATGALRCAASLGELHLFRGDSYLARSVMARAASEHSPDGRFLREWAAMEKRLGDLSASSALYKQAVEKDPADERAWLQWGQLERRRGEPQKALECWQAGLKSSPLNPYLWQSYATLLWDEGRRDDAREAFRQGLSKCPGGQSMLLEWAVREAKAGNKERALEIVRLGGGEGKGHAPLLAAWVKLATELGREEEAVKVQGKLDALLSVDKQIS